MLAITAAAAMLAAGESAAQVGYYRTTRPDAYRELSRTGKYHGYWRDLGYGVNPQQDDIFVYPTYGVPYYGGYGHNVYGVPHGRIDAAPGYYHPPASFPYRYRY
jgi:hypothetical protein